MKKQYLKSSLCGLLAGFLNGLFGAGGGLIVVPLLEAQGLETKKAHATSIAIILPLSIVSTFLYLRSGVHADWETLFVVVPLGFAGAALGALLLQKINSDLLKRIFGAVMVLSAIRILLR